MKDSVVLDDQHRARLAADGIVHLKGVASKGAAAARAAVFAELTRLGYRSGGKWHTRQLDGVLPFQVASKLAQALPPGPLIVNLVPPSLVAELSAIAGGQLRAANPNMQLLVTPPQKQEWIIPTLGWHVDLKPSRPNEIPGLQVFVLLDDVRAHGGGTMAIKGSHVTKGLRPNAENVVEMSGQAGDVYVMDMRVLHAPSINATRQARIMAAARFVR